MVSGRVKVGPNTFFPFSFKILLVRKIMCNRMSPFTNCLSHLTTILKTFPPDENTIENHIIFHIESNDQMTKNIKIVLNWTELKLIISKFIYIKLVGL